jgi:hypothetical protein
MFAAPTELMSDDAALRAQTFDEIRGFGVRWLRSSTGTASRPCPRTPACRGSTRPIRTPTPASGGRAHALRSGLGIYLTEFGVGSRPDPLRGVSFTAQSEYRSISERIAYRSGRVRAFSQYLMRDDGERTGFDRFGGVPVRAAHGRGLGAARIRRLPPAARGRARPHANDALGTRPARARRRPRVDRLPAARLEPLALPRARPHEHSRLLDQDHAARLAAAVPRALDRPRRHAVREPARPQLSRGLSARRAPGHARPGTSATRSAATMMIPAPIVSSS